MSLSSHRLGKQICNLNVRCDMWKNNKITFISFTYKVTIHFNVLSVLMKYRFNSYLNGTNIVSMKKSRHKLRTAKLRQKTSKPNNLRTGRKCQHDTQTRWKIQIHDLLLTSPRNECIPKKIYELVIEQRVSTHLTQLAQQKNWQEIKGLYWVYLISISQCDELRPSECIVGRV